MKIVLWGTYDIGKPRVRLLRDGIRKNGFELIECHTDIWNGIEDKSQISGVFSKLTFMFRLFSCYPSLVWRYLRLPAHALVLVSYPGLFDVLVIRCFAWLRRAPVAWDVFISAYDTVVDDRRLFGVRHPVARLLWGLEWLAVRAADGVFMDTEAHARRVEELFRLHGGECGMVSVGVETEKFPASPAPFPRPRKPLQVLFYGQFIPLHGIGYIVEAAGLLRDEEIDWILIGKGQETPRIRELLANTPLPRLRWLEWVDYPDLITWIQQADICLGIFGNSKKAANVIPNKVYQIIAAQKPLITRDSPAIRELLQHSPPCTVLIPAGDAGALANVVKSYADMPVNDGTTHCHVNLTRKIDAAAVGAQFHKWLLTKENFRINNEN
ncbi:glycosyltransferase involved in cell wall biosynthesis [Collimonas sp. PA-H2]|uniref:glycosyltransferase n=1 Tax=Collimonas sp. PA-H2 TaxID=1881062 RepID=UPI000BF6909C|nr:glycosyltransferase [Collimonas sp. PA-H2]PFH10716.1 glycosyltransferase involved in cell wall biosynthesis [Collimonas sp. PA-H2]